MFETSALSHFYCFTSFVFYEFAVKYNVCLFADNRRLAFSFIVSLFSSQLVSIFSSQ